MAPVTFGPLNAASLILDDVYVAVQQPQPLLGSGTSLFNGGCVGAASWGPYNTPKSAGTSQELSNIFGPPIGSGFDILQEGSLFLKQGPIGGVTAVRVSDGTGAKAVTSFQSLAVSGYWEGTFGNQVSILLLEGTLSTVGVPTWRVVVQAGAQQPEVFDNISQSATASTTWANIIAAINSGQNLVRPKSNFVTLALSGAGGSQPTALASAITLTGGADGATLTSSMLIGVDGAAGSRTGLYALRGQNLDQVWLCGDRDFSVTGSTLIAFAHDELCMVHTSMPVGQSPTTRVTNKTNAGLADPYLIFNGDDVVFLDSYLNNFYSVPQSCVVAGVVCSIDTSQSPGNRSVSGILGTYWTYNNLQSYSNDDLGRLESAGIMTINNPIPAGSVFGLRFGKNSIGSSNFAISEIPYGRKTNDLVKAFSGPVMGQFINKLQSTRANDPLRESVQASFNAYLGPQKSNLEIDDYRVTCDLTNNPPAQIKSGVLQADVIVAYLSVVDKFIINLTAGQTVSVSNSGPSALPQTGGV